LENASPVALRSSSMILSRINAVKKFRLASDRKATKKLAETPKSFGEVRQPVADYLFIPKTSSELRHFVPIGFVPSRTVLNNTSLFVDNATLHEFGILSSTMHNAWVRYTCGRLKSDFRYSAGIVYNNYPWPQDLTDKQREAVSVAAQGVLDARAVHQKGKNPASLADLYNGTTMPTNLSKAHAALDKVVDAAYGKKGLQTDSERVAYLFALYDQYTSLLA
jgi:hypothetical protein